MKYARPTDKEVEAVLDKIRVLLAEHYDAVVMSKTYMPIASCADPFTFNVKESDLPDPPSLWLNDELD